MPGLKPISRCPVIIYLSEQARTVLLDITRTSKDANRGYTRGRADPVYRLPEIIDQTLMLMKTGGLREFVVRMFSSLPDTLHLPTITVAVSQIT